MLSADVVVSGGLPAKKLSVHAPYWYYPFIYDVRYQEWFKRKNFLRREVVRE